jgi:hypothetical protein
MADDLSDDVAETVRRYPRLAAPFAAATVEGAPDPGDGRQMESFPADEADNPHPGRTTLQVYNRNPPGGVPDMLAGDMASHYLAANDPAYAAMQAQFRGLRTPGDVASDVRSWRRQNAQGGEMAPGDYQAWLDRSRIPSYARAAQWPASNPGWRGHVTPEQRMQGHRMLGYLKSPFVDSEQP